MDVGFILDYTSSMGTVIEGIKTGITSIISTINTESGSNDYRLGLVLADEDTKPQPDYETSVDYAALPAAQRIINTGASHYQYITAVEMFADNNETTFVQQLNKINTGAPTAGWPLGNGDGFPEPTDMALGLITCATQGIKVFVLGLGTFATYTPPGGTLIYPWRVLADATSGGYSASYDTATVISQITNACGPTP